MRLDLRDIIEMPGRAKEFETVLDPEPLLSPSIARFTRPPEARGRIENTAGLLNLRAELRADMVRVCDRCGTEFAERRLLRPDVPLAPDPEDGDDGELYPLDGDGIDPDQVLSTCFLLETGGKCLCRPDCLGLCPLCGKNLNDGPCGCQQPKDPRFAVLEQLLDDNK